MRCKKGDRLMKKNSTAKKSPKTTLGRTQKKQIRELAVKQRLTVGLDLGDRSTRYCILDETGEVVSEGALPTTKTGLESMFGKMAASRVALEVGTHSPWVSRHLAGLGHEVIVANAHKVKLITQNVRKNDRIDARQLARLARVDLATIRARAEMMEARTRLVNSARGLVKPMGERLPKCDADQAGLKLVEGLKEEVRRVVEPLLKMVEAISEQIGRYDEQIAEIAQRYPEEKLLRQVYGVGRLIAMTYVLTLDDAERFSHSRDVGPYLGLTRKTHDSGDSEPELRISKAGDGLLRSLLVQGAHCILRKGAPDSDLREWGLGKAGKGGKRAKKRAVVAVARKLAVLLHHLWVTGEVYDRHYNRKAAEAAAAKRKSAAKVAA